MKNKLLVRKIKSEDKDGILAVELNRYKTLYSELPYKLKEKQLAFEQRIKIASDWMWVLELDGQVKGFITGQPTDKSPDQFTSWEESTDNGSLESTFDENGKNVYVVNLDVDRDAAKLNGQYLLMAQLGSQIILRKKNQIFFESRMPEFREWISKVNNISMTEWNRMDPLDQQNLANQYSKLRTQKNGKLVLYDRLLRFYEEGGFRLRHVVPNAFQDPESLNFGVLCTASNPIPEWARFSPINYFVGKIVNFAGSRPNLLEKFIK